MENDIEKHRDISIITGEIKEICERARRMALIYSAEIGRRLVEAKEVLPYGEWGHWLSTEVGFSQRTAQNHMKIFEAYGSPQISLFGAELNSQAFADLSYTQALQLLALPAGEREDFVKSHDMEDMSTRDLQQLIKERDEARAEAAAKEKCIAGLKAGIDELKNAESDRLAELEKVKEELEMSMNRYNNSVAAADKYNEQLTELQAKYDKAKAAEKKAKEREKKYKELSENPEIPQATLDKLKAEAEAAAAEAVEAAKHAAEQAHKQADDEFIRNKELQEQIDKLKTEAEKRDSLAKLNVKFENIQRDIDELLSMSDNIDGGSKYKLAMCNVIRDMVEVQ